MPSDSPPAAVEAAAPELSEKKTDYGLVDDADTHASDQSSSEGVTAVRDPILDEFDKAAERRILRKVDWHLVPACGLLYFVCAIDRINLGAAEISGMKEELQLGVRYRYSLITLVYFFTYVIFQAPATLAVRFLRPQLMLPTLACAWTALMLGASFTTEWTQMVAVRMLLGVCEAALYPAVVYLLSTWYLREEMAKRYGYWLLIARMASTFGPFFQYGFIKMDGVGGRRGWRWVFAMDGVITFVAAVITFFVTCGFPDRHTFPLTGRFLTERERQFILARVDAARADARPEPFTFQRWIQGGKDFKIWLFGVINMCCFMLGFGILYFAPSIIHFGMGFSAGTSTLLLAAPDAVGSVWMMICCYLSDRTGNRGIFLFLNAAIATIGLPILGFANGTAVRFFGLSIAYMTGVSNIPIILAYQADNIRGQWKRSFCSASLIVFQGLGGILAGTVFREKDAPEYRPGLGALLGSQVLVIVVVATLTLYFRHQNKLARTKGKVLEGMKGFTYVW